MTTQATTVQSQARSEDLKPDALPASEQKILEAIKKGERVGGVRCKDAVNVPTQANGRDYETLTTINKLTGGAQHQGQWRMYLVGPFVYVWHERARKVVRVPMSNVAFIEEHE